MLSRHHWLSRVLPHGAVCTPESACSAFTRAQALGHLLPGAHIPVPCIWVSAHLPLPIAYSMRAPTILQAS